MSITTIGRYSFTEDTGDGESGDAITAALIGLSFYDKIDALYAAAARCSVFNNGTQSIASGAFTALTFNAEDVDDYTMHSTAVNTSRVTIPTGAGGVYLVGGGTFAAANATGIRQLRITKNGGTQITSGCVVAGFSASGVGPTVTVQGLVVLAAADYLELEFFQDSGGALAVGQAGATHNYLQSQLYALRVL